MTDNRSISWRTVFLSALFGTAVGYIAFARSQVAGVELRQPTPRPELHAGEQDTIRLFKTAAPSVVYINTSKEAVNFFGDSRSIPVGTGSGYVWDDAGHIVTNYHVVAAVAQGENVATVNFNGDDVYEAKLIGVAPEHDIAVLKITPKHPLTPIPLGESHDLQVGQQVLAIGNPFGLDHTLTVGIVSALGRTIPTPGDYQIEDAIQTDAAINPGNSGGPLLDSYGRLIGMNTAIYSPSGVSAGIGFAIPVDTINRVVPQLIQYGMEEHATLGIGTADSISARISSQLGVNGVAVLSIAKGSAAEAAGLQAAKILPGRGVFVSDIILELDGKPVTSSADLDQIMRPHKPGDTIALKYWRENTIAQKKVMLDSSVRLRR